MPRGDGTGPRGAGPMTGRAAGYCAAYPAPKLMIPSRGYGRGFGRGRYFRPPLAAFQPAYPQAYSPVTQPGSSEQKAATLEKYQIGSRKSTC